MLQDTHSIDNFVQTSIWIHKEVSSSVPNAFEPMDTQELEREKACVWLCVCVCIGLTGHFNKK